MLSKIHHIALHDKSVFRRQRAKRIMRMRYGIWVNRDVRDPTWLSAIGM